MNNIHLSWREILAFLVVIAAFGYASHNDYEDEVLYAAHYCDMVKEGRWPNYNHINCNEVGK